MSKGDMKRLTIRKRILRKKLEVEMATLNKKAQTGSITGSHMTPVRHAPIVSSQVPNARTATGGLGYLPADAQSELLDLGSLLFAGGEKAFHESGAHRDARFKNLTEQIAQVDPEWTYDFLIWLRSSANIRTASLLGAMHATHARLKNHSFNGDGWNRKFISDVPRRLDEVKDIAAYWTKTFGPMPPCVKRGLSDAIARLANEYSYMKYGIQNNDAWTVPDVIDMVHAKPGKPFQSALYGYALADRHGNLQWEGWTPYTIKARSDGENVENPVKVYFHGLNMIMENRKLRRDFTEMPEVLLDPARLKAAGFTWEDALSLAGSKVDKAKLWESLIFADSIPISAMIKNLRNMEQAGISRAAMKVVQDKITNPTVISRSYLMPFEVWAAYKNTQSIHWHSALEDLMTLVTANVPSMSGRTLVLVDASYSMFGKKLSNNSSLDRTEAAAIFAAAIALKNEGRCDVYTFSNDTLKVTIPRGASLLATVKNIMDTAQRQGQGTQTVEAVRTRFNGHDRVIILTDEQSFASHLGPVAAQVPADTFMYSFDLAGYRTSDIPSGKSRKHQLFGLTDQAFKMIKLLEDRINVGWPWKVVND